MAFQTLLGNESLKRRLSAILRNNKISHCYAVTGPEGSGKQTLARLFAAAIQCGCVSGEETPCLRCGPCRKVLEGTHPDVILVDDSEHRQIPIKLVRETVADAYIRPNEGNRKIYIFPHAEKLSQADQNALLKMLEEPPSYATFFLLIPNATLLLPTIRSRCAELPLSPLSPELLLPELERRYPGREEADYLRAADTGYLGMASELLEHPPERKALEDFVHAYASRDPLALLELMTAREKTPREQFVSLLEEWRVFLADTLCARYGLHKPDSLQTELCERRSPAELSAAVDHLAAAEADCLSNVSVGAICGALAVRLSE